MAETKKKSVGLIAFTHLPETQELVAILQRRGKYNLEIGFKPETYPGGCRVTANGEVKPDENKLKSRESFETALLREVVEELGGYFRSALNHSKVQLLYGDPDEDTCDSVIYGILVKFEIIKHILLAPSTGGLMLVYEHEVRSIHNLRNFNEKLGVNDINIVAMFPDEIEAVGIGFNKFNPQ